MAVALLVAAGSGERLGAGTPKAFVVLKNGHADDTALLRELKEHVKARAGTWKYPRWIEPRESLPRTATGKVQRYKLREEEASRPDSS